MTPWRYQRRALRTPRTGRRLVGACDTGTCRDDPIPVGVYWLDVPWEESQQTPGVPKPQHFQLWLSGMQALGWVKLLRTVHHEGSGPIEAIPGVPSQGGSFDRGIDEPPRDWHLFEVLSPAPRWTPQTGLGLPTVAPRGIQTTEDDTIQSPELEPISVWDKILPSTAGGKALFVAAAVGIGGLALYGIFK